jgi:hypothetical protein
VKRNHEVGMSLRNGCLLLLSALSGVGAIGSVSCSDKHLHVGDDGTGGHGGSGGQSGSGGAQTGKGGGQAGAAAGAAGSIVPSGAAGTGGTVGSGGRAGTTGAAGAAGQAGAGGAPIGNGLSVNPSSASFAGTLVESVSAARTFTVRNDGAATAALAALQGTNAADFRITANACGATLAPGASCDIAVAFAPKIRSGARSASLAIGSSSNPAASVSLSGTALPSLTLLAGAIGGPGYADGTGTDARFYYPVGVAADAAGNLYVADSSTYTIRKIAVATGAVTTLVGAPRQPGAADGIGAAAGFTELKDITSDGAGNLYVIDDRAIRTVVIATGAVTTLFDDNGAEVHLDGAYGIAADGAGYLYVTDDNPNSSFLDATIRRIAIATGTVTTIADRTGASIHFNGLYGVASDHAGNLYAADADAINRVAIVTGAVTPLTNWLGWQSSVTLDGAGSVFIAGGQNGGAIDRYVIATADLTSIAGTFTQGGSADGIGIAASFAFPKGMSADGAGNLFVADNYNHTIRKVVVATGAVTTFAGTASHEMTLDGTGAAARFGSPLGIASDGAGNLYVVDRDGDTIRKIVIATGAVTTFAGAGQAGNMDGTGTSATFLSPTGIAADGAGNLYVTDGGTIRKIVIATRAVTTIAGAAGQDPGAVDGVGAAARFSSPSAIASDGSNNLFVADGNGTIRKIVVATRAVTTLAGKADETGSVDGVGAAARFDYPTGIAADGAGNVYVADYNNKTIRKIVVATGAVTTFAGKAGQPGNTDGTGTTARFTGVDGVASDGAGTLYVLDNGTVRRIAIDSATVSTVIGSPGRNGVLLGALPASLNLPSGLAVLPTGELVIGDNIENSILMGHL